MNETVLVQGRRLQSTDIGRIRELLVANPTWSRYRLSQVLSAEWNWRTAGGRLKDMAARTMLVKLEARGLIELPLRRRASPNRMMRRRLPRLNWDSTPVEGGLRDLGPLTIREVGADTTTRLQVAAALEEFHYLGCRGTVGENLQYAVTDGQGRLLACLLFGAAAWKCRVRDEWIGWTADQRQQRLQLITNNTRFLILPSVRVSHLASWILGRVMRRLSADWEKKYGHPILLVETFVERDRFAGTSYKAANWVRLGETTGRSRQDRDFTLRVPVKDVYVYAVRHDFRRELSS
jgi:Druantia protein DruA